MRQEKASRVSRGCIRKGDTVMVISGGNKHKDRRVLKGKIGKVLRFVGTERLVVEGLNMMVRHQKATGPNKPAGKIEREAPIHISNVMFYAEKIGRPVRLKQHFIAGGKSGKQRKVRGYMDPKSKQFVQIDA